MKSALAAAVSKFMESGVGWITTGAAKYHFLVDAHDAPTDWGLWVASHPTAAVLVSLGAVVLEGSFILHAFSHRWPARLIFGGCALLLLTGFWVFQGVFWHPWWVLMLVFVPWDTTNRPARLSSAQVAVVGALIVVQAWASLARVEMESVSET